MTHKSTSELLKASCREALVLEHLGDVFLVLTTNDELMAVREVLDVLTLEATKVVCHDLVSGHHRELGSGRETRVALNEVIDTFRVADPLEVDAAADVERGSEPLAALLELLVPIRSNGEAAAVRRRHELLARNAHALTGLRVAAHLGHDDGALDKGLDNIPLRVVDLVHGGGPVVLAIDAIKANGAAAVVRLNDHGIPEGILGAVGELARLDGLDLGAVGVNELGQGLLVANHVEGTLGGHAERCAGTGEALAVGVEHVNVYIGHGEDKVDALLRANLLDKGEVVLDVGRIGRTVERVHLHRIHDVLARIDVRANNPVTEALQGFDGDVSGN